ncbi:MAG: putative signal transduction protein with domain [Microbacteriaceae bacterium]|nr:putative signal transduction protein with domain [Microbacteriaceae bacterium]
MSSGEPAGIRRVTFSDRNGAGAAPRGVLKGMLTDRDIVVKCIAQGGDPRSVTAGSLGEGKPITVGADDDVHEALRTMKSHQVRRLPVIDGHEMVGIISQADVARSLSPEEAGKLLVEISE